MYLSLSVSLINFNLEKESDHRAHPLHTYTLQRYSVVEMKLSESSPQQSTSTAVVLPPPTHSAPFTGRWSDFQKHESSMPLMHSHTHLTSAGLLRTALLGSNPDPAPGQSVATRPPGPVSALDEQLTPDAVAAEIGQLVGQLRNRMQSMRDTVQADTVTAAEMETAAQSQTDVTRSETIKLRKTANASWWGLMRTVLLLLLTVLFWTVTLLVIRLFPRR